MIVKIKEETKEYQVVSVWLARDYDDPQGYRLKMFFCPTCQNPLLQYKGTLTQIVPGELPYKVGIILRCPNCKVRYMFHSSY